MNLNLRNPLHFVLAMLMAIALSGCANMASVQKPVTPQDYVQSLKGQIGAAYKSVGDLKAQNAITSEQGNGYVARIDAVRKDVDKSQDLVNGGADLTTVQGALKASLGALTLVQAELNAKMKGK